MKFNFNRHLKRKEKALRKEENNMRISKLNKAEIISLDNEMCHIAINKIDHTIIQTRQWDNDICQELTEECEKMESEYTIGDMVIETPYKGGIVMSKLLNNRTDKKCMNFINLFNVQLGFVIGRVKSLS